MLSKTSIVICGMLLQGEMNAYDMLKMIERMNMQYWHPIGATTLYETCLRLEKKRLYRGHGQGGKQGRLPPCKFRPRRIKGFGSRSF